MRWDSIGTTTGPTQIGGTLIPKAAELLIPVAEPGDIEECPACRYRRSSDASYPADEREQFRLHLLERHVVARVRFRLLP